MSFKGKNFSKTSKFKNNVKQDSPNLQSASLSESSLLKLIDKLDFGEWYNSPRVVTDNTKKAKKETVEKLKAHAQEVHAKLIEQFSSQRKKDRTKKADNKWIDTILASGTLADKAAAYVVMIQENPFLNFKYLQVLLNMSTKKERREAMIAINSLKDIFLSLLPQRKLFPIEDQDLSEFNEVLSEETHDVVEIEKKLQYFHFENNLKKIYHEFIKLLERGTHDNVEFHKESLIKVLYDLLLEKPEQEKQILSTLVNKLGDIQKVIGSKVSYLLSCLIEKHPNMKLHVVKEVEQVLYRSNVGLKAQYYGIVFLNQILLHKTNPSDQQLASKLVTIYFSLFNIFFKTLKPDNEEQKQPQEKKKKRKYRKTKETEKTKEESNNKLINESKIIEALLVGIHRAFPYVPFNSRNAKLYQDHLHHLFTISHSPGISGFSKAIYSLLVIFQIILAFINDSSSTLSTETVKLQDRYYRALYESLLRKEIAIASPSKQTALLNLLYKSLKIDTHLNRVKAFIKRLLQICSNEEPNFICASLFLVSQMIKDKPEISELILSRQDIENPEVEKKVDSKNPEKQEYSPSKRDPSFANADTTYLWELLDLSKHYHPTVQKFSKTLLGGECITYSNSDPFEEFSLTSFLDRFVYKNPKKKNQDKDATKKVQTISSLRKIQQNHRTFIESSRVNSDKFLAQDESKVPEDKAFFYKYFSQREKMGLNKNKKGEDGSDSDEIDIINDKLSDDEIPVEEKTNGINDSGESSEEFNYEDLKESDFEDSEEEGEEDLNKEYNKIYNNPELLADSESEEEEQTASETFAAAEDYTEEIEKALKVHSLLQQPLKKQKKF